jgi:hypothetical protein
MGILSKNFYAELIRELDANCADVSISTTHNFLDSPLRRNVLYKKYIGSTEKPATP